MTRVLVIGGGGVFGAHLVGGLVAGGFEVVIAGRRPERLAPLIARFGDRATAVRLDAATVTPADLQATGVAIVADAAGPFQNAEPRVARATIAAGLHYVDLADARDFVAAFPALDEDARRAGVVALAGCSSTPALSNAVLDDLTRGWTEIVSVEAGISPGARAPRGLSVMQATLSWLGRPVRVFEAGGWTVRPGWSGLHRRDMGRGGRRWLSLSETPDLDLFVERFRPSRSAWFLAGLQPGAAHLSTWMLGRVVRLGLVDPRRFPKALLNLGRLFSGVGDDRGAMRVSAYGRDAQGRAARATWQLVAEPGAGPVTPSLPALAAIKAIAAGRVRPGASACVGVLPLGVLEAEIRAHPIVTARTLERGAIFARAIGPDFDRLPAAIRDLHETPGESLWRGETEVVGAAGPLARVIARIFGFPATRQRCPVTVAVSADGDRSIWRRRIGDATFSSVLGRPRPAGRVTERFGLLAFDLILTPSPTGLSYDVAGWKAGPVRLPSRLAPKTTTSERVDGEGRFVFDVDIALPSGGRLVHYRGWLERDETAGGPG
ncbi:hypothetical protein MMB232_01563 [Brevundimonas subvibrioides]|uniref:DUF4166 domain-containing protein n=1 Tax=Brevundimonas subvibrioides TaxID=74313 RepID=UPI0032D5931C